MDVKKILINDGFRFEKKYGQNFLTDETLLGGIVEKSGAGENDTVLEIGVGAGTLTREIAKRVKKVYGYEIDKKLKAVISKTLGEFDNVEIIFEDVMRVPMKELEEKIGVKYTLIANLPYYITTPVIMRFAEQSENCESISVTVQKEVAERLAALPGTSDYGAITASLNLVADCELTKYIGREKFFPSPNVDSAVVKITFDKNKFAGADKEKCRKLIKNAFLMRRKTLVNNLMSGYSLPRAAAENLIAAAGIDKNARGESLSAEDFVRLCGVIEKENAVN